jgi:ABC-2 type transport system ATP-binding protein
VSVISEPAAVEVENLSYRYGERVALKGISFAVPRGEIFGLLGPNGGGKTTLFRILSTLLQPEGGAARIFGADVAAEPLAVRCRIGVVFQNQSLDRRLTAEENLVHQGHLYGLKGAVLSKRISHVLERLGIAARRGEVVEKLSGGLRRRVELAKGLIHQPELLLLDEPSTGVDPGARLDFWEYLKLLRREEGVTILLTTHLLDEADKCDRLAVLDEGSIVAEGTPQALKSSIGGDVVLLTSGSPEDLALRITERFGLAASIVNSSVRFEHPNGSEFVSRLMHELREPIDSVTVSRPTLEDVFIHATGHRFGENAIETNQR